MRGSIRRRDRRQHESGPERWELRVFLGRDDRGRQLRLYRAFSGTKREAESALAALVTEIERGRQITSSRMRFADYATQWLASREAARDLEAKTLERYRGIVRDHLVPQLGTIPVGRISVAAIRKAVGAWRSSPRRDRKTGLLSEKSIHDHFALLKQILAEAVRERLLLDNPAALVRAPGKAGSRRRIYTMAQVVALVNHLRPTSLALPVLVKALTGLRRGELLALRWRHVDLTTGEVNVVESLERQRDGSLHFKAPKTDKSARIVILPAIVVEELIIYRGQQIALREQLGMTETFELVFCEVDGAPWDPDRFSSAFAYRVKKSGLPRVSLQELRHSFSSMSQRAGTPLTTTSQSMGHSTTILTADRYSHAILEDFRAAADRIERTYRAASSPS